MSATVTAEPMLVRMSALDEATSVAATDLLLVLQQDTSVQPPVYRLRRVPATLYTSTLAQTISPQQFADLAAAYMAGLPTTLPNTSGVTWNNQGVISQS